MDFIDNTFASTTYYAPTATPQYNAPSNHFSTSNSVVYTAHDIEKEQPKHINNGHTDIIEVGKKGQDVADFLVYGNKKIGLANDIAAVLAKIVAEQTAEFGQKNQTFINNINAKNHFLELVELEIGSY